MKTFPVLSGVMAMAAVLAPQGAAQQTIFNVPSADIADKHDWFYQHQTTARAWNPRRQWLQTNAFGYGIGHYMELDATLFNLNPREPGDAAASFGFKASIPVVKRRAGIPLRLVAGDLFEFTERALDARRLPSPREGNWIYVMLHTEAPRLKTRLTAGVTDGTQVLFGAHSAGFLGGIEQPLSKRWMFQVDWFSGHHELAFWIPGVVYRLQRRWMISTGLQFPNRPGAGQKAVVLELTRF